LTKCRVYQIFEPAALNVKASFSLCSKHPLACLLTTASKFHAGPFAILRNQTVNQPLQRRTSIRAYVESCE